MTNPLTCQSCGAPLSVGDQGSGVVRCTYCGTEHAVAIPSSAPKADYSRQFTASLFRAIARHFTEAELRDLVLQLDAVLSEPYHITYDDLAGGEKRSKARELVMWCERRRLLQALLDVIYAVRPSFQI
jgi:uncharacterized Zn finger protein (UPF0148 family)